MRRGDDDHPDGGRRTGLVGFLVGAVVQVFIVMGCAPMVTGSNDPVLKVLIAQIAGAMIVVLLAGLDRRSRLLRLGITASLLPGLPIGAFVGLLICELPG